MMTASSVAIMNRGRMRIEGNSGITLLEANVTAPFRAKALPSSDAPVFSVIDVSASMFTLKV